MLSPIFYVTFLFWSSQQVYVRFYSALPSPFIENTSLQPTKNSSTVPENPPEQFTKSNYKLEQLFDDDDLNGLRHKTVIIEAQINGKVFKINNKNSTEWESMNRLMNNEIHERQDHIIFEQEREAIDSSTDVIRLKEIVAEPNVISA